MVFKDPHAELSSIPVKFRGAFGRWRKIQLTPLSERFWKKVKKGESNECWPFLGPKNHFGYGVFSPWAGHRGRELAHRQAWKLQHGDVLSGIMVCHKCDNPPCCNPNHLFSGTPSDNVQDCLQKGRFMSAKRLGLYKLKAADVRAIRSMYSTGRFTQKQLAATFGVTRRSIGRIALKQRWRHIK